MRPSLDLATELAEEGGRLRLLPLADGRDMSVLPLGRLEPGGEGCPGGRAAPYGPPEYATSLGVPPRLPYRDPKESLEFIDSGDSGPGPGPGLLILVKV